MRLATEEIGAAQVGSTVGVVKAARDLVLGQADAREHIPPVLVPVAVSVPTVPSFLLFQLLTVRPTLATTKWTPVVNLFPRVAHVLKALVALSLAVIVRDAGGEDGDVPQPWVAAFLLLWLKIHAALSAALQ